MSRSKVHGLRIDITRMVCRRGVGGAYVGFRNWVEGRGEIEHTQPQPGASAQDIISTPRGGGGGGGGGGQIDSREETGYMKFITPEGEGASRMEYPQTPLTLKCLQCMQQPLKVDHTV